MDPNARNKSQQESLTNQEEKEMKAKRKYYGKIFVTLIFSLIILEYYVYVYQIMWPKLTRLLITFHLLLFMMLWSLIVTMNTHPGEIPLYWGFYIGDEDYKRKRYCLICNAFKPERSHHCSVCNTCVLNMDHHCPWVDNCIGFYNRKYFMQLLFYLCILNMFIVTSAGYDIYLIIFDLVHQKFPYSHHFRIGVIIIAYGIVATLSVLITMFFKFHLKLVLSNSTTIESLDKDHASDYKKFNLSKWDNWIQVFGENYFLWFFPVIVEAGRPRGDGLTWKTSTSMVESSFTENKLNNNNLANSNLEMGKYKTNYASNLNNYNSTSPFSPSKPEI